MVRILTDSACDMPPEQAKEWGIDIIPNIITFSDGTVIRDSVDMTSDEFYRKLASAGEIPHTSQPGPGPYLEYYEAAKAVGDSVVTVLISGGMSSLSSAARLAMEEAGLENSYVVDSFQASLSQQIQVRRAARLRDEGATAAEIAMTLELEKRHAHLLGMVEDLDHLRRGGRVTVLAHIAGKALGIKPLIEIDRRVLATGKARGIAAANAGIIQTLENMGGIHPEREYMLGYSTDPHQVDILQDYIVNTLHLPPAELGQIGASVGTHVGPGTFGIVFYDRTAGEL